MVAMKHHKQRLKRISNSTKKGVKKSSKHTANSTKRNSALSKHKKPCQKKSLKPAHKKCTRSRSAKRKATPSKFSGRILSKISNSSYRLPPKPSQPTTAPSVSLNLTVEGDYLGHMGVLKAETDSKFIEVIDAIREMRKRSFMKQPNSVFKSGMIGRGGSVRVDMRWWDF
jgi:hypothetical protein